MSAISIQNLSFRYTGQPADCLSNLDLEVAVGESFGLFGPNGAGKTTLMSLMTGLIPFSKGSISLSGQSIKTNSKSVRTQFGFVPQDFSFYQELSPAENLEFFGAWSGLSGKQIKVRTNEVLRTLDLESVRDKPVYKFSGGMKRRVNLAIAVIHQPTILFLDEPTVGVDVQTRQAIIQYLKMLNRNGTTLIYTSHQLSEAEELCDVIALMDEGVIVAQGPLDQLLAEHKEDGLEGLFMSLTGKKFRE